MPGKPPLARISHFAFHTILHSIFGTFLHPLWGWLWGAALSAVVVQWALLEERDPLALVAAGCGLAFVLILIGSVIVQYARHRKTQSAPEPRTPETTDDSVSLKVAKEALKVSEEARQQAETERNIALMECDVLRQLRQADQKDAHEAELAAQEQQRRDSEPATDSSGVQQLKKVYRYRETAVQSCYNLLQRLCMTAREQEHRERVEIAYLAELIEHFVLRQFYTATEDWEKSMAGLNIFKSEVNRGELHRITSSGGRVVENCGLALVWIEKIGSALWGEQLKNNSDYSELHEAIRKFYDELESAAHHPHVSGIAVKRSALRQFLLT